MKLGILISSFLISVVSYGLELEYLSQVVIPTKMNFQKTKIGGLSGLVYDASSQKFFAICDDRGLVDEPRIYQFKIQVSAKDFKVEAEKVIFLTVNESELSHKSTSSSAKIFSKVLDLEGISLVPWGDFLITNEGDTNKKPRVMPQVLTANPTGTIMREYEVPTDFLPESSGPQKKGIANNLAFEGLAAHPNGKNWMVATEGPLLQDPQGFVRFIQYDMPEAWILKPGKEFKYPIDDRKMEIGVGMELQKGISEIQYLNDHQLLVMERRVQVSKEGMGLQVELYLTDLNQLDAKGMLIKKLVLDLKSLEKSIGSLGNFEGMSFGPPLHDGRRSLILVSDDNFMKSLKTQFLLFAVKTP